MRIVETRRRAGGGLRYDPLRHHHHDFFFWGQTHSPDPLRAAGSNTSETWGCFDRAGRETGVMVKQVSAFQGHWKYIPPLFLSPPTSSRKLPARTLRLMLAWRRIRISLVRLSSGRLYLLVYANVWKTLRFISWDTNTRKKGPSAPNVCSSATENSTQQIHYLLLYE